MSHGKFAHRDQLHGWPDPASGDRVDEKEVQGGLRGLRHRAGPGEDPGRPDLSHPKVDSIKARVLISTGKARLPAISPWSDITIAPATGGTRKTTWSTSRRSIAAIESWAWASRSSAFTWTTPGKSSRSIDQPPAPSFSVTSVYTPIMKEFDLVVRDVVEMVEPSTHRSVRVHLKGNPCAGHAGGRGRSHPVVAVHVGVATRAGALDMREGVRRGSTRRATTAPPARPGRGATGAARSRPRLPWLPLPNSVMNRRCAMPASSREAGRAASPRRGPPARPETRAPARRPTPAERQARRGPARAAVLPRVGAARRDAVVRRRGRSRIRAHARSTCLRVGAQIPDGQRRRNRRATLV